MSWMTTYDYISLFLIDPVVRQTRRWSAFDFSDRSKRLCRVIADRIGATADHEGMVEGLVEAAFGVVRRPMDGEPSLAGDGIAPPVTAVTVQGEGEGGHEPEQERNRHDPSLTGRAGAPSGHDGALLRRLPRDGELSGNPSHGVIERFTSPVSSPRIVSRDSGSSLGSLVVDAGEGMARSIPGHNLSEPSTPEPSVNYSISEKLPADDGQGILRQRIMDVRNTNASAADKALLMHGIMNERYRQTQAAPLHHRSPQPGSPSNGTRWNFHSSQDSCQTMTDSGQELLTTRSSPPAATADDPYWLSLEDVKPTFVPAPSKIVRHGRTQSGLSETEGDDGQTALPALGCQHYKRNVKLQCSTCNRWYTCRFCHDAVEDHFLIRKDTKHMLCMLCGSAQPAGETCTHCGERTAWYYCGVCKLWDDDSRKSIYHCPDCGICRIGRGLGKDFFTARYVECLPPGRIKGDPYRDQKQEN